MPKLLEAYVLSRGQLTDYRDLGPAQREDLWPPQRVLSRLTDFTRPSILLLSRGREKSLRIAGIASTRQDQVKTPIRFDFTVVWSMDPSEEETLEFLGLFFCLFEDLKGVVQTTITGTRLGARLDQVYPASTVEAALDQPMSMELTKQTLATVLSGWEPKPQPTPPEWGWIGGFGNEENRALWLQCAAATIGTDCTRSCLVLNTVSTPESALMIRSDGESTVLEHLQCWTHGESAPPKQSNIVILGRGNFSRQKTEPIKSPESIAENTFKRAWSVGLGVINEIIKK